MSVQMTIDYQGELHCSLTHGPSNALLETDAPADNHGRGAAFSPTDLVGAALGSCALTTMAIRGPKEGIPVGKIQGTVVKEMTTEPPRRIAKIAMSFSMPPGLSTPQRDRLEQLGRTCPVARSLAAELEVDMRFTYPD